MSLATSAVHEPAEPSIVRAPISQSRSLPPPVRFVQGFERDRVCSDAERARAIVLRPPTTPSGELRRVIDADLESALAVRGAMPAAAPTDASYVDIVADQLLRAASLPVRGLCLALPTFSRDDEGMIAEVDAKILSVWIEAARRERRFRLVVLLDALDRTLSVRVPRSLEAWLDVGRIARVDSFERDTPSSTPPPSRTRVFDVTEGLDEDEIAELALSETAASRATTREDSSSDDDRLEEAVATDSSSSDSDEGSSDDEGMALETAIASEVARDEEDEDLAAPNVPDLMDEPASAARGGGRAKADAATPVALIPTMRPPASRVIATPSLELEDSAYADLEKAKLAAIEIEAAEALRVAEEEAEERAQAARLVEAAQWRTYACELDEARGPRPVSVIEKLFATRYVPLVGAIARGEADLSVRTISDMWRQSFAESYEAAYSSLRVTGKRPPMVMDAPEIAHRIARLASARSVKLVLIDSMSFDIGERVAARIGAALEKRAALVEKNTLWAALPATTPTQLHLLARGAEGLKDPQAPPASQPDISRGRAVATFRRERLGGREVLKLDVVEARLRAQGAGYDERLDAIADEVSDLLVKLFDSLPPRTLAYVFGDHGFVLPHGANGWPTGAATQGGATPEEVLVSGQAWLIDAIQ